MALSYRSEPSVAVLPFVAIEHDSASVREGLEFQALVTEALLSIAAGEGQVLGPASNEPGLNASPVDGSDRVRARELGVRNVVSGTVAYEEDRLLVFSQVVRSRTGRHLWAGRTVIPPDSLPALARLVAASAWDAISGH